MTKKTKKAEVAEIVTQRFVDALQSGRVPWIKPWDSWKSWSRLSGNYYRGVNQLLLDGGEYVTFKQAKEQGLKVNKGAKSSMIVNYTEYKRKLNADQYEQDMKNRPYSYKYWESKGMVDHLDDGGVKVPAKSIRYYNVFSVEGDTDGERKHNMNAGDVHDWDSIERAEEIVNAYLKSQGLDFRNVGNSAFWDSWDMIQVPRREQFKEAERFYSTLFHELIHTTSKPLKRDISKYHSSNKERAREELVAEIGAAYIMSYLGIENWFTMTNSSAYVAGWAEALNSDVNAVLYAAPKAIEAAELILASVK